MGPVNSAASSDFDSEHATDWHSTSSSAARPTHALALSECRPGLWWPPGAEPGHWVLHTVGRTEAVMPAPMDILGLGADTHQEASSSQPCPCTETALCSGAAARPLLLRESWHRARRRPAGAAPRRRRAPAPAHARQSRGGRCMPVSSHFACISSAARVAVVRWQKVPDEPVSCKENKSACHQESHAGR